MVLTQEIQKNRAKLGMGVMRFPMSDIISRKIDRELGSKIIHEAIKLGVNYFDTAYGYHRGDSEKFLGEVLKDYQRDKYFIATKLPIWKIKSLDDAKSIFEEQQERLQTNYFDYYFLHNWQGEERFSVVTKYKIIDFLHDMKEKGYIRNLGFSYHDVPEVLEKRLELYQWDIVQLQINYVDWELQRANESCEILKRKNIPVIAMEPVRGGMLAQLDEEAMLILSRGNTNLSPAALALRWVATQTDCEVILSGMSTIEQLKENASLFNNDYRLSENELYVIEKIKKTILKSQKVLCTACRYCCSCPAKIDIPEYIKIYNRYLAGAGLADFGYEYEQLQTRVTSTKACLLCNKCMERCPQKIEVPVIIKEINKTYQDFLNFH